MNWKGAIMDAVWLGAGAVIGVFAQKYLPFSGLMLAFVGFAVIVAGGLVSHDGLSLLVSGAGVPMFLSGITPSLMKVVPA